MVANTSRSEVDVCSKLLCKQHGDPAHCCTDLSLNPTMSAAVLECHGSGLQTIEFSF